MCHSQITFSAEAIFRQSGRVDRHLNWESTNPSDLFVGNHTIKLSVIRDAPKKEKKTSVPAYCCEREHVTGIRNADFGRRECYIISSIYIENSTGHSSSNISSEIDCEIYILILGHSILI